MTRFARTFKTFISFCLLATFCLSLPVQAYAAGPEITSLTVIDADTDLDLWDLGLVLNLYPVSRINLRANTSADTKSVRFWYDGNVYRTESTVPFAFSGDNNGNYNAWTPSLGVHTVTAIPYSATNAQGTAGTPVTIVFTAIRNLTPSPSPSPVPSPFPSPEPSPTPEVTPSPSPDPSPSPEPSPTPSPSPEPTPEPSPTIEPSPSPSPTPEITPSPSPEVSPSPEPTPTVEPTPSPSPTMEPSPSPEPTPSPEPSPTPSPSPEPTPSPSPEPSPTAEPSPSPSPSASPVPTPNVSVTGTMKKWQPITFTFDGPASSETATNPNPFTDFRFNVTFSNGAKTYVVPGYFAGNGEIGSTNLGYGDKWRVYFTPDEVGQWQYTVSFRQGGNVAMETTPEAGMPAFIDGATGSFEVIARDENAPGFLKWGRLEYVGTNNGDSSGHYLKFRDGSYWLKGGADSPENLLGYVGFDNSAVGKHSYAPHVGHWQEGDPVFNSSSPDQGKGLIGAINYLASEHVNSVYLMPMNVGGDAKDTSPFVSVAKWTGGTTNDNLHYDVSKLTQWEQVFSYLQQKGLQLHFVLSEAEAANKNELDAATLGIERKLFYREMIARFGHHNALQWNVSEEYDNGLNLGPAKVLEFANYIKAIDPYQHPITVHQLKSPDTTYPDFLGPNSPLSLTSFQFAGSTVSNGITLEKWRSQTTQAGKPFTISLDEIRSTTTTNMVDQRKKLLWPTYLSGGMIEWYNGGFDQTLEDFSQFQDIWRYTWYARKFVEEQLPFWQMEPMDGLLTKETGDASTNTNGGQVFAKPGEAYAIYIPNSTATGKINLATDSATFTKSWYNPRTGEFEGTPQTVVGGSIHQLGVPPSTVGEDWVVLLKKSVQSP